MLVKTRTNEYKLIFLYSTVLIKDKEKLFFSGKKDIIKDCIIQ